jgi:DNA/RNA-binding domain of Phe-tRNA-synthetase-like protein
MCTSDWLASAAVDPAVHRLTPDYSCVLVTADGLRGGPSDEGSERVLRAAEEQATALLGGGAAELLPHVAAWREAYRSFGAKPQRTRSSVEALLRRLEPGLPRIDRVTDLYNAISISHVVPVGGEDRDRYVGPARLIRADGSEPFDTTSEGQPIVEQPVPGEVVWRDESGVTCRRWNWRQCTRTRISTTTSNAVFILDGLAELGVAGLVAAADALQTVLTDANPGVELQTRLIRSAAG